MAGVLDSVVALVDLTTLVGGTIKGKGGLDEEAQKLLLEAMLFVLTADDKLAADEIAFLRDENTWMPERGRDQLDLFIAERRDELMGLDDAGRAGSAEALGERMAALEGSKQRSLLVVAALAAAVDRSGFEPQRRAFEQLVKAVGADLEEIDLEARVRMTIRAQVPER